MGTVARLWLAGLLGVGCGQGVAGAEEEASSGSDTGGEVVAETDRHPPEQGPSDGEATATPPPPTPPRAPVDPATIVGYVRGMRAPQAPRGSGQVAAIQLVINQSVPSVSDLTFEIGGPMQRFAVVVPNDFPHPLVPGETVSWVAGFAGGGPNGRATMMIHAADGTLLLAVDRLPDGWIVEQGRRESRDDSGSYREDHHAVVFTHARVQTTVGYGDWGKITTPDGEYLVWGAAAQRQLRPSQLAPPDYVGAWLDFTISRLR